MSKVQRLSRKGVGEQVYGFSKQYSPIKGGDIVRHPWKHGSSFTNYVTVALEDRISALTTKDPNKLKIYIGVHQYELSINSVVHQIQGDQVLRYDGQELTGDQLYEKLQDSKL